MVSGFFSCLFLSTRNVKFGFYLVFATWIKSLRDSSCCTCRPEGGQSFHVEGDSGQVSMANFTTPSISRLDAIFIPCQLAKMESTRNQVRDPEVYF